MASVYHPGMAMTVSATSMPLFAAFAIATNYRDDTGSKKEQHAFDGGTGEKESCDSNDRHETVPVIGPRFGGVQPIARRSPPGPERDC